MIIFWRLLLSHLIADFALQLDIVNRLKRRNIWGMVIHCMTHFVVSAAMTWNYLPEIWFHAGPLPVNGWGALVIMLLMHFAIDELRIYSMKTLKFRDNTVSFLTDQFLHLYVLLMITPVFAPGAGLMAGEKWSVICAIFVLVTHFTTVLIFFLEKGTPGREFPQFDEKYFLIFERVVLWTFFFTAGYWWIPFALAWVLQFFYIKRKRIIDISRINVWLSVIITSVLGVWTRYAYYGSF